MKVEETRKGSRFTSHFCSLFTLFGPPTLKCVYVSSSNTVCPCDAVELAFRWLGGRVPSSLSSMAGVGRIR